MMLSTGRAARHEDSVRRGLEIVSTKYTAYGRVAILKLVPQTLHFNVFDFSGFPSTSRFFMFLQPCISRLALLPSSRISQQAFQSHADKAKALSVATS